jgi:CBS domain-containing protein
MQAKDITKPASVVSEGHTLREVIERMDKERTNTVLVIDDSGVLSGEVSVSDLFDAIIPDSASGDDALQLFQEEQRFIDALQVAADRPVSDFMNYDVTPVYPEDTLITIAAHAISHQRARLPVVNHADKPVGIISRQGLKHILATFLQ